MKNLHEVSRFNRVLRLLGEWLFERKKEVIEHDCFAGKWQDEKEKKRDS